MTKKDFIGIADCLRDIRLRVYEEFVENDRTDIKDAVKIGVMCAAHLAIFFEKNYKNFDRDKFSKHYLSPSEAEKLKIKKTN